MDHNLNDSLNLESDIGSMDFDHSGVVVNQEDITLETTDHDRDMPMELENIELQPTLMDTGNEEIIVSDFMSEQFTLQEYNTQDYTSKVTAEVTETVDANQLNILTSHSDSMIDLKFDADALSQGVAHEVTPQPKFIQVKAAVAPTRTMKKESLVASSMPRQVAIAPKPPCSVVKKPFVSGGKQYAIAPKPVTLVTNKGLMKMSLTGQGTSKTGNAVLTQIGKQLVMVPATGGQKLKLVTSSGSGVPNMKYAQLVTTKQTSGSTVQKPLLGKFIVQGQSNTDDPNQPAVITKIVPGVNTTPGARYVMQQKTVPITIGGTKVLMASPTKQGIELKRGIKFRNPIISLQSSTQKSVIPVTSQVATTTKKVVITSNPQNVILKTTAPPKTPQVSKEGTVIMQGQKSQLHQINVPGKGIQYIRLITNPTPAPQKTTSKAQTAVSFVLADNKVTTKPQKKLVRIAPVAAKPSPSVTQQTTRSSQSLLAPLSPVEASVDQTDTGDVVVESVEVEKSVLSEEYSGESGTESKTALRALLGETEETDHLEYNTMQEVEVEFETKTTRAEQEVSNSMMDVLEASNTSEDHPLIVIPSNYSKQNQMRVNSDIIFTNEAKDYPNIQVDVEGESVSMPYLSPKNSQALSETDNNMAPGDLEARPRKACNCTKSQCLKLYCDCFANGEFCNQCNCNNCHNNLDNEGLRQKAIRACLDRNPNAFRPKIGKSKSGGPEIIRRHNKGCNCKRSGCLKNYCECYEAKIACTTMCKCVGCRNVEETLERRRDALRLREKLSDSMFRPPPAGQVNKQPCSFMTSEVIEAVCQCLIAAAVDSDNGHAEGDGNEDANVSKQDADPMRDVIEEFARCLQDIISASHQSSSVSLFDEGES